MEAYLAHGKPPVHGFQAKERGFSVRYDLSAYFVIFCAKELSEPLYFLKKKRIGFDKVRKTG